MMRLSTMWAVDCAIDRDGRSPIVDRILERWPHDEGSARFFRSSANFIATFQHDGRRRFLRFADASERRRDAIAAELELVAWLAGVGLDVATPEPSQSGALLETIEVGDRTFHAVVFAGLIGEQPEIEHLDEPRFRAWGEALGRLHAALKTYPGGQAAARRSWRDDLAFVDRQISVNDSAIRAEFNRLRATLDAMPADPELFGLIHFDFELDNLVWRNGSIAMLDFDDCAYYWYVADIAFALRDLLDSGRTLDDPSVHAFLEGYAAFTAIDERTLAAVPTFSRLIRLLTYARIMRSLDIDPGPEYPDWLNGLTTKLRDHAQAYRESLPG